MGAGGPMAVKRNQEKQKAIEDAQRIARVNAQQTGSGIQMPPWMEQQQAAAPPQTQGNSQLPMPSWVPQGGLPNGGMPQQGVPRTPTPPVEQLALHKRAPKTEAQALSQALRQEV